MGYTTEIRFSTLHPGQIDAYFEPGRFKALRCGRRWGKTELAAYIGGTGAINGESIGYFAPDYKILSETYNRLMETLDPVIRRSSKTDGIITTRTGGRIDFWTLENDRAGRSRRYHKVLIDEAAFTKANMLHVWNTAIRPTLLDFKGSALVMSTPNGVDEENFFYQLCTDPKHGFTEYHAPTSTNPYMPEEEIALLKTQYPPLVFRQEYLAEFVDWAGAQFFALEDVLVDGKPVDPPPRLDAVFAVVDTAIKSGQAHDGTAVSYYGISKHIAHPLYVLDWDLVQIEGSLLEVWLPTVDKHLEGLAKTYNCRVGSLGIHIEDKVSGTILIQQALRKGINVHPIDSILTAMGKDERAIDVSGYVYQKKCKMTKWAYDKVTTFKQTTRNHFLTQVFGFRIGDKDSKRADDLLDTFCYALAIAFGDQDGV